MKFPDPLIHGRLIKRYKRFLADVTLDDGTEVTAHCANPGSMTGLANPGAEVWLSPSRNPKRKLKYSWELVRQDTGGNDPEPGEPASGLVGVSTAHPNGIVAEAISAGQVAELTGYQNLRREVKYGKNSRIDILLEDDNRPPCYVEVKNVNLCRVAGLAEFPDAVTARGTKHLHELTDMVAEGARAVMFYMVQRDDCSRMAVAADIDPTYAAALQEARKNGVETLCYDCTMSLTGIYLSKPISMQMP